MRSTKGRIHRGPKGSLRPIQGMPARHKAPVRPECSYEIKHDSYGLEAVKANGAITLFSRRGNILNRRFQYIVTATPCMVTGQKKRED